MASGNKPKSRNHGPDFFPEVEAQSDNGATDTSHRPGIADDDGWLGDTVEAAVIYAGAHHTGVDRMMV